VAALLNGFGAGQTFRVEQLGNELVGRRLHPDPTAKGLRRLDFPFELFGKLPLQSPPRWLPGVSLRDAFVLDELATWFANRGLLTGEYVWKPDDIVEVARVVWQKRLPITPSEIVSAFAAHGVPNKFHLDLGDKYQFGMRLLIASHGRLPIKKRRLNSFEDADIDPRRWFETFVLPGLTSQATD